MAALEPTEDAISQVIEVTELDRVQDRDMVRQALKSNNGDAQTVILNWYEDPSSFRQKYVNTWDESVFTADRDGSNHNAGISFHIEAPAQDETITGVTPPPESHGLIAPSRPPSRTNSRSPLGRMADWAAQTSGVPSSQAQEDEDMQRALRESAQEAGISMPAQESGVVSASTSTPYFGPANRSDYEQGSWAMVPAGKTEVTVHELSPPASRRKRVPGAPAFLVRGDASTGDHRLGGLLTILHEIPLARNALLQSGDPVPSYGHNSEWWKGQEILAPHVLARLQAGELTWGDKSQTGPVFEEEIHRLMAFLDSTERSYGTVSVLFGLIPYPGLGTEKQFYELLGERNAPVVGQLYTKVVLTPASQEEEDETEEVAFGVLETEHVKSEFQNIKTLYESLDHVIWGDVLSWGEIREGAKIAMFKDMGEVVVINMSGEGPDAGSFDIPEEFYPERWLDTRKEEALQMMKSWEQTKRAISALEAAELRLYEIRDPNSGTVHDRRALAQKALEQWEGYCEYLEGRSKYRAMSESGFDTNAYPDYRSAPSQMTDEEQNYYRNITEVTDYTKNLLSDVAKRVKELHVELDNIRTKQRILGRLLTDPDKPGRVKPMTCKKYLLRGIATSSDVIYVCQRKPEELIELDIEPEPRDQWWRLAYSPQDGQEPIQTEPLNFDQVRVRMWQDTTTPLLVYATESALDATNIPLSEALERFIKAENKAFSQELSREEWDAQDERNVSPIDVMTSPSKRKHRSDSMDSMLSNRASAGSRDQDVFDQTFDDLDIINGVEMTPMSETLSNAFPEEPADAPQPKADKGPAPPLPDRPPVPPKPDFLSGNQPSQTSVSQAPLSEQPLVPEMQERSRPPSFLPPKSDSTYDRSGGTDS